METLQAILIAAKTEFMLHGYENASLRTIVKNAGVTTGALYGYFHSKEELFDALVKEHYDHFMKLYQRGQDAFKEIPKEQQPDNVSVTSGAYMHEMLLYAYAHLDAFKLLVEHSTGTKYETMISTMVDIEIQSTNDYLQVLDELGRPAPKIDEHLSYILVTGMFNAFFELIVHEMPLPQAEYYLEEMKAFYTAGWMKIMNQ